MMVDRWLADDWEKIHNVAQERLLKMPGASHHQGNHNLKAYQLQSHGGAPLGQL
ncbi:unnamed protein product, partial [Urochloa humidicola]